MDSEQLSQALSDMMDKKLDERLTPINERLDMMDNRLDKLESEMSAIKAGQLALKKEIQETLFSTFMSIADDIKGTAVWAVWIGIHGVDAYHRR